MNTSFYHTSCKECEGRGKIELRIGKRARRRFLRQMSYFEQKIYGVTKPKPLIPHVDSCQACNGRGIISSESFPEINHAYPHLAIIGGGIGGFALATACLHRGIPYSLYERDESFDARSQGYGLTLQQASKAMAGLGVYEIPEGLISIMHKVHIPSGKVIGEWGRRKLSQEELQKRTRPRNIHISRQGLRKKLFDQTHDTNIFWGHHLQNISCNEVGQVELGFQVDDSMKTVQADIIVGADGIRSKVRSSFIGDDISPLQYLGCIVILGICPLEKLSKNPLLDGETVFQTVNGYERIYMMPYDTNNVMWQMSFPLDEDEAKILSKKGPEALKQEAIHRLGDWHEPIPEILEATDQSLISGYPVYDREILDPELLKNIGDVTLLGDAMHPMSPFKGQGANQAILDALDLARDIATKCGPGSNWREKGLRNVVLEDFEKHILERSAPKVRDSATAVKILHSDRVLHDEDTPRGRGI